MHCLLRPLYNAALYAKSSHQSYLHLEPQRPGFVLKFLVLLFLRNLFFFGFARILPLVLLWSPERNVLGLVIPEKFLQTFLNDPAGAEVEKHNSSNHPLEVAGERNKLELGVELRNKLGCAGECDTRDGDQSPVHALILADGLAERSALVVDGKSRDLLDELKEIDGRVEQRGLKLLLEIRVGVLWLDALDVLRDINEGSDMNSKLSEDRADNISVENVVLRSLLGQRLDGLV